MASGLAGTIQFMAQQAARALAIERLEPLGLSPRAWGVLSTQAEFGPLTQIELVIPMSIHRAAMVYLIGESKNKHWSNGSAARTTGARNAGRPPRSPAAGILVPPLDTAERRYLVEPLAKVAARWP